MKRQTKRWVSVVLTVLMLSVTCCSENPVNDDSDPIIPLDGRGGGIIVYCYQPMQSGIHQIFGINADGTGNRRLITASVGLNHHGISPDGLTIAATGYVSNETWSIYTFNFDGSGLTRLTQTPNVWDSEPVWSPDGERIAFNRIYPSQNNKTEIWIMDADGADSQYIGVEGFSPKWSPDGLRLIYCANRGSKYKIYTCQTDGSDELRITDTDEPEMFPVWSPDGSRVLFVTFTGTELTMDNLNTVEICVMNSDGTDVVHLTDNEFFDSNPKWSPDGTKICFESDRDAVGHWEVYFMNSDGTGVQRVTHSPASHTAINPVWKTIQDRE